MKPKLITIAESGLGDRINMLLATDALAQATGREPYVVWPLNDHCGAPFESVLWSKSVTVLTGEPHRDIPFFDTVGLTAMEVFKLVDGLKEPVVKLRGYFKPHTYMMFNGVLSFSPRVLGEAELFADRFFLGRPETIVGCHARAGDKLTEGHTPPTDEFLDGVSRMLAATGRTHVFIASDGPDIIAEFRDIYCDRLIARPTKYYDRAQPQAIFDAAVELSLLRMLDALVLSAYSEFSWNTVNFPAVMLPQGSSRVELVLRQRRWQR